MKKIALIILSLLIVFSAGAKKHKHKKKITTTSDIKSVSMRRTGCYGRCPDYSIEINSDGTTIYTGRMFVTDTGTFRKNIGTERAATILAEAAAYRLDTCQNLYQSRIADLPGMIITVQYNTQVKTINNANFGPAFLRTLAADIDKAGGKTDDNGWKKIPAPPKK
jgi:hypothetical protein